jgi:curved DNA-binding protein CbpA
MSDPHASTRAAFLDRVLAAIPGWSYYQLLRIEPSASTARVREAFRAFALEFHPDEVEEEEGEECRAKADAIFRRGAEAYRVLGSAATRARYDEGLCHGNLRLVDVEPKPRAKPRTLEDIAATPKGKAHARKADQLLSIGDLDSARAPLVSACQQEPDNKELAERLEALWEALALTPG